MVKQPIIVSSIFSCFLFYIQS